MKENPVANRRRGRQYRQSVVEWFWRGNGPEKLTPASNRDSGLPLSFAHLATSEMGFSVTNALRSLVDN